MKTTKIIEIQKSKKYVTEKKHPNEDLIREMTKFDSKVYPKSNLNN